MTDGAKDTDLTRGGQFTTYLLVITIVFLGDLRTFSKLVQWGEK